MANDCRTYLRFIGNQRVQEQVLAWEEELVAFKSTKDDPSAMHAINKVFYNNNENINHGCKWLHYDPQNVGQLDFLSAWHPPHDFLKHLALKLYKCDPHVVIRTQYETEGNEWGFVYTSPMSSRKVSQAQAWMDVSEFLEDEELDLDAALNEVEEEAILENFICDVPHVIPILKDALDHLKIDWEEVSRVIKEDLDSE